MAQGRSRKSRYAAIQRALNNFEKVSDASQLQKVTIREIRSLLLSEDPNSITPQNNFDESPALDKAEGLLRERLPEAAAANGVGSSAGEDKSSGGSDAAEDFGSGGSNGGRRNKRNRPNKKEEKESKEKPQTGTGNNKSKGGAKAVSEPEPRPGVATATGEGLGQTAAKAGAAEGAEKLAESAAKGAANVAAEKATAGGAARAAATKTPWFWIAVGVALIFLILIFVLVLVIGGGKNKLISGIGGSLPRGLDYDNGSDRELVEKVKSETEGNDPVIEVVPPADPKDLWEWKEDGDKKINAMDKRVLQTLDYMVGAGWEKIVIGLLKTNGPEGTRRQRLGAVNPTVLDAQSAYSTGQAMGIVALGKTSAGLTRCMGLSKPVPVMVSWQGDMADNVLRPIYEQLQVDLSGLAFALKSNLLSARAADGLSGADGGEYASLHGSRTAVSEESARYLEKLRANLGRAQEVFKGNASAGSASKKYAADALNAFGAVDGADVSASEASLRRGMNATFRMMQVANMTGWEGSKKNGCALWKAFEARQNIRRLALQVLQMPVVTAEKVGEFNADLVVKQMIVYSLEDDLDNGLPDQDVFPSGAKNVDVGGMSYDTRDKDGKIDEADNNFMALPTDNGILAKLSTVFLIGGSDAFEGGASATDPNSADDKEATLWDGSYNSAARQSYKNFIHIGF